MRVGRFAPGAVEATEPAAAQWRGWLESKSGEWVMFVAIDGSSTMFLARDSVTGAVLTDDSPH